MIITKEKFPEAKILIPPRAPTFVRESMNLLFEAGEILESDRIVHARSVAFASHSKYSGFPDNDDVNGVRNAFDFLQSDSTGTRKIYVSRRNAARAVENESQFEALFEEYGFDVVLAEKMTFREQVELFSSASCVAGFHGAGFTNLVHAPAGCRVIELFRSDYVNSCFARLSSLLGQTYTPFVCNVSNDEVTVPDGLAAYLQGGH